MRKLLMAVGGLMVVAAVVVWGAGAAKVAAAKPSSQSKSGIAVAYAKVDIADEVLLSFGGKGTTAAEVTFGDSNSFAIVQLTGKYPKDITSDQVIVSATAEFDCFCVATAGVLSANPTQLLVEADSFRSATQDGVGGNVYLTVYLGH